MKCFIFSFPRSGLHLLSTIIGLPLFVNFKEMKEESYIKEKILDQQEEVLFTHQPTTMLHYKTINFILSNTKPIFLFRDVKDVLLSWCLLVKKNNATLEEIKDFIYTPFSTPDIKNPNNLIKRADDKIQLWKDHINGYKKYNLLKIKYENLINDYNSEKNKIENYLNKEIKNKLPELQEVEMSRKGKIGDYINYFDEELINDINKKCKNELDYINSY